MDPCARKLLLINPARLSSEVSAFPDIYLQYRLNELLLANPSIDFAGISTLDPYSRGFTP